MKRIFLTALLQIVLFASLLSAQDSSPQCPSVNKVPDINCDGSVIVTIVGDSLVSGIGDEKNDNKGGYVLRASKKLKDVTFNSLGVPGIRTLELLDEIEKAFTPESGFLESDIVVLDAGRNDRWLFGEPAATYRNLKRVATKTKDAFKQAGKSAPVVITAVLMLPNRGSQGPWVKDLNAIILRSSSDKNPADLRFDLVSKRLLNEDQLHPTSKGYDQLAKTLVTYLTKNLPRKLKGTTSQKKKKSRRSMRRQ